MGSLEKECLDALAVRRLFVFMKENLDFESLQDELIQRELLHEKEKEDYIYKTKSKHFWNEKLIKLIIKKRRCKEFIEFINDMPCLIHISEKIVEIQKNTESSSSDLSVAVPLSDALLQEHLAILYNELEPREIADEMFQAGHINVSDHDDVTECPKKWKRMKCLLNILKKNKLYTPFGYTLSLKYVEVLDVLQQGKETTSIASDHAHCIQHNFTLLQTELPGTDIATVTMEHILDESNISDIECCFGVRRQKSKLLKILLMKGDSACLELLRVVEVELKRVDLLQTMKKRSANIKERGKPKLSISLQRLEISCIQEHEDVLHDELDPSDHSDLLFEERAIEIIAHDQITESDLRSKQTGYLLKTIKENKNDCFHFFLYILQKEEYEYILQKLCERPAPKIESSESVGTLNWRLSHSVKKVPDGVLNENISVRLSIEDCSRAHVEENLFERIQSPDFGILEEAIVHGQMIPEDINRGSIILHLRPVTDEAAQTLLNAKDNNKLLEMIFRILKKVKVEDIIDEEEPLKIKVQVQYAKSSKEKQDSSLSKVGLIKKRVKIHSDVLVSELEPKALASLLTNSTNLPDNINIMYSVNNARSCKERVEEILSLVEAGNAGVVEDFMTALKNLEYFDIVELIDPSDIHRKAENIRKVITYNYQHILNEMQMALVRETLSKCIGDVDCIREKCLPRNGQRRQRMSQFLQFVLQDDHNVIEFERVLKKNGLDSLLKIDENSEGGPTPNIDVTIVEEDHNSLSSKEVLFESTITLSYTGNCQDRKITLQNGASQRDFDIDDEDDNYENKASDFVSLKTISSGAGFVPDFESDEEDSDKDEVEQLLADVEERQGFHTVTVRKEVVKPHKPLVEVEFDPVWNKKIGAVEKTSKAPHQRDFDIDDEDDNYENKASDFVSLKTISPGAGFVPDFESDEEDSNKDEVEQLLADVEERQGFHTVTIRKEVVKPHKPLVEVEFDPVWNKKIGAVEKISKAPQQDEDSPAEEVDSKQEDYIDCSSPRSWIEEVDFVCESEVSSNPESEYDALPEFESDSDSDAQDDTPVSSNPVDACMTRMTLSQNVTIEYPDRYHVDPTRAVTWSQEKRAAERRDITLQFMEKMCTDIYLLVDKRDKKKVLVFDQSDEAVVTFSVKVNKDEKDVGYRYEARIKNKSNWVTRMANCKGDEIKFHATEVESFYIVNIPIKETEIIQPEGNTLSFKHSGGVYIDMPSQTVEIPQPIAMQLSNVDKCAMEKRHSLFPEKFKLQKISQRLYVQHDIEMFNKAFSVKLDLESFGDTDAGPLEPVAIIWNDGEPTIKSKAECSLSHQANKAVMTMKNFPNRSGLSVGLVAPGKMNQDEAKLAYADVFLCKITIHIKIDNPQEATVYINCVMIENLPTLLDHYKPQWLIGISEDLYLKNFQRIRVHLSGNSIQKKSSRQKVLNCFIVFSNRAEENCLSFRIDKDTRMGGCPNTVLDFSLDSGSKRKKLHRQEFDPWMLVGRKPGCLD